MSHDDRSPQVSHMGRIASVSARERFAMVSGAIILAALIVGLAVVWRDPPPEGPDATDPLAAIPSATSTATPARTATPQPTLDAAIDAGRCPSFDGWAAMACEHRGMDGERFDYVCPPDGDPREIWGDGIYTDDSSVCTAAVHAGRITLEDGGTVAIIIQPDLGSYSGTTRNGITSDSWGAWEGSFVFVAPE